MDVDNVNLLLSDGVEQFAGLFLVSCAPVFGLQFPLPGESVDEDGLSGWLCALGRHAWLTRAWAIIYGPRMDVALTKPSYCRFVDAEGCGKIL